MFCFCIESAGHIMQPMLISVCPLWYIVQVNHRRNLLFLVDIFYKKVTT